MTRGNRKLGGKDDAFTILTVLYLRDVRVQRHMTLQDISVRSQVAVETCSAVENLYAKPSLATVDRLASALEMSISDAIPSWGEVERFVQKFAAALPFLYNSTCTNAQRAQAHKAIFQSYGVDYTPEKKRDNQRILVVIPAATPQSQIDDGDGYPQIKELSRVSERVARAVRKNWSEHRDPDPLETAHSSLPMNQALANSGDLSPFPIKRRTTVEERYEIRSAIMGGQGVQATANRFHIGRRTVQHVIYLDYARGDVEAAIPEGYREYLRTRRERTLAAGGLIDRIYLSTGDKRRDHP